MLAEAARRADALADELERHVPAAGPEPRAPVRRDSVGPDEAHTLAAAMPFDVVIGSCNPVALPLDHRVRSAPGHRTWPRSPPPYEGAPGCVHGAVLAGAFDIMLTAANVIADGAGPTVSLAIRYLKPTLIAEPCPLRGLGDRAHRSSDLQPGPADPGRRGHRGGGGRVRQHGPARIRAMHRRDDGPEARAGCRRLTAESA